MEQKDKDARIIAAVLQRLNEFRLPRMLALKKKVDGGEVLDEFDLQFMKRVLDDTSGLQPIVERNPKFQHLYDKALGLCEDILEKSEENESAS